MRTRLFLSALGAIILGGIYTVFILPHPSLKLGHLPPPGPANTSSTDPLPGHLKTQVKIYLVALNDGTMTGPAPDRIGCKDTVVAVNREIPYTPAPLRAALSELLSLHDRMYGQSGLYNSLYQSNLNIDSLVIDKGIATIKLIGTTQLGGVCDNPRFEAQLMRTALQFPSVKRADFFINDMPLKDAMSLK